jgi:hypothetical protein
VVSNMTECFGALILKNSWWQIFHYVVFIVDIMARAMILSLFDPVPIRFIFCLSQCCIFFPLLQQYLSISSHLTIECRSTCIVMHLFHHYWRDFQDSMGQALTLNCHWAAKCKKPAWIIGQYCPQGPC